MCMCKLYLGSLLYTAHLVNGMAVAVDLWLQQGKRWVLVMSKQQRLEGYTHSEQKLSSLDNTEPTSNISFLYPFIIHIQLESIYQLGIVNMYAWHLKTKSINLLYSQLSGL